MGYDPYRSLDVTSEFLSKNEKNGGFPSHGYSKLLLIVNGNTNGLGWMLFIIFQTYRRNIHFLDHLNLGQLSTLNIYYSEIVNWFRASHMGDELSIIKGDVSENSQLHITICLWWSATLQHLEIDSTVNQSSRFQCDFTKSFCGLLQLISDFTRNLGSLNISKPILRNVSGFLVLFLGIKIQAAYCFKIHGDLSNLAPSLGPPLPRDSKAQNSKPPNGLWWLLAEHKCWAGPKRGCLGWSFWVFFFQSFFPGIFRRYI